MPTYDIFNLSTHCEHIVKIVESIPKNWSYINGLLYAPTALYDTGKIATNTRLKLSSNYFFSPLLIASNDNPFEGQQQNNQSDECYNEPNLVGILHEHLLPSSLEFIDAGKNPLSFELARNIIIPYLRQGYKGKLQYTCGEELPRAHLEINDYTKTLELALYPEHKGQERIIDTLYRTIRQLKLKERSTRIIEFPNKYTKTQ